MRLFHTQGYLVDNRVFVLRSLASILSDRDSILPIVCGDSENRYDNCIGNLVSHFLGVGLLVTSKVIPRITSIGSITLPRDLLIFLP